MVPDRIIEVNRNVDSQRTRDDPGDRDQDAVVDGHFGCVTEDNIFFIEHVIYWCPPDLLWQPSTPFGYAQGELRESSGRAQGELRVCSGYAQGWPGTPVNFSADQPLRYYV